MPWRSGYRSIAPFYKDMSDADKKEFQKVRRNKNIRAVYHRKMNDPDTGELAKLAASDKAAVSSP